MEAVTITVCSMHKKRTPEQELLRAICSNNLLETRRLLQEGVSPDAVVFDYSEDTLVHHAARQGLYRCLAELLKAGAECDKVNAFGVTPMLYAARGGHASTLQLLFRHCRFITGISELLRDNMWSDLVYNTVTDGVLATLIIAFPDMNKLSYRSCQKMIHKCVKEKFMCSLNAFILVGYTSDSDLFISVISAMMNNIQKAMNNCDYVITHVGDDDKPDHFLKCQSLYNLTNKPNVYSLQHLCRLNIRNSFLGYCNVYYGCDKLALPTHLKQYLVFYNEIPCSL